MTGIEAVGQCPPDQGEKDQCERSNRRQDSDSKAAETQMVAVKVEEGQKNSQHTEIQKVLRSDNKMI